jgi:hypothetical protein
MLWPTQCIEDPTPHLPCGVCQLEIAPSRLRPLEDAAFTASREFSTTGRKGGARLRSFVTGAVWLEELAVRLYESLGFVR